METKLFPTDVSNIVRSLSLLKDHCNDVTIREGILRQRSNDRVMIFEFNFTPLIGNCNIVLPVFKEQLPLLKALSEKEVTIITTEKAVTFSSQRSMLTFDAPKPAYVDNKFIPTEEASAQFPKGKKI